MKNIKYSTNYNYKEIKSNVVTPSRMLITDTYIEIYDSEGKLRVRMNKD